MHYKKLIRKWAKLRNSSPHFADVAITLYKSLNEHEREAMLAEFQDYIDAVKDGRIIPSPVKLSETPKL